ncbi:MAG: MotA/TolQ/ExbB proton channel family protein [Bdellovibrionales bacterium]|nr:MotA/TolQ/ExbB proton channel family protein [Bdellovibrionales bacterium]
MEINIGQIFFRGGWVMWPLLIFSVLSWAVILERIYTYVTLRPKLTELARSLMQSLSSGNSDAAKQICQSGKPYITELFVNTLDTKRPRELAERMTERSRVRLMSHLKRNLWVLGTIGSASPFIGLLGTVVGIVKAFHNMSEKGAGGFSVVAGGISEALIATAAGLVVAIVALITYNIFVTTANQTINGVKLATEELLDLSYSNTTTN